MNLKYKDTAYLYGILDLINIDCRCKFKMITQRVLAAVEKSRMGKWENDGY